MESLPPAIRNFAAAYLPSLEALEVLTLCVSQRDRWHDASAVARTLGIPRSTAREALDQLACSNLLDIRITGDLRYRFRPGTSALEAQAVAFVGAYRRTPLQVLELMAGDVGQTARDVSGSNRTRRDTQ
jgi:DNA-binding IclR family transcriptional regulator